MSLFQSHVFKHEFFLLESCPFPVPSESNPKAASQLFDKIRSKCKLVASFPSMGKSYGRLAKNLRGFIIDDYIIFYYPQEEEIGINITRIASGYRDLESLFE
ncbi:MAG: type II toxin-antitoxin system RelE/ParE family toxin [Dolichospermum sp. DET69]|nr:MAG: type II toxin-antitoxin system RelE/ParE family toxin [Dolichospermum sp. DET69]